MCVVSNVSGQYQKWWPQPITFPFYEWEDFKKNVRKAIKQDEDEGNPDCTDPEKAKWMEEVEKIMVGKYGLKPLATKSIDV